MQVIKGMSKNRGRCEASIARVYSERVVGHEGLVSPEPVCNETDVIGRSKSYVITDPHIHRLFVNMITRVTGVCPDISDFRVYKKAKIGGKEFTVNTPMTGARRVREKCFGVDQL